MQSVPKSKLRGILVPLPDSKTQEKLYKKIIETDSKIVVLQKESEKALIGAKNKVEKMILGK